MRQFIESMFYLDVVRCRKCRGGVGEFYTAPALFLHRVSIYFLHKIATRKSGSLFYFFDFLFQPIKAALCVYSFRNITNAMANMSTVLKSTSTKAAGIDEKSVPFFFFRKIFLLYYEENCYYNNVWKSVIQFTLGRQR